MHCDSLVRLGKSTTDWQHWGKPRKRRESTINTVRAPQNGTAWAATLH